MKRAISIEDRVAGCYGDLSARLRDAADYVVNNPVDIATRSLRSVSAASGVSPATLSRLARVLGFDSYEELREQSREAVGSRVFSFSEKAALLEAQAGACEAMLDRQAAACMGNITRLVQDVNRSRLQQAVDALEQARNVILFGAFGSTGIVEYMSYLANYFATNWTLAGRMGASLGSALASMEAEDVLLVVTKAPYARRAIVATETARSRGAQTILITDTHACPAIGSATCHFIVPSDSPQFFSSYAATLVLMETMIAMLVAQSERNPSLRIREVEESNRSLGEFWAG